MRNRIFLATVILFALAAAFGAASQYLVLKFGQSASVKSERK